MRGQIAQLGEFLALLPRRGGDRHRAAQHDRDDPAAFPGMRRLRHGRQQGEHRHRDDRQGRQP
jgi:hypothetical protein